MREEKSKMEGRAAKQGSAVCSAEEGMGGEEVTRQPGVERSGGETEEGRRRGWGVKERKEGWFGLLRFCHLEYLWD